MLFWCIINITSIFEKTGGVFLGSCFTIMELECRSVSTTIQHFQGSGNLKSYSSKKVLTTQIVVFNVSLLVVHSYHVTEG